MSDDGAAVHHAAVGEENGRAFYPTDGSSGHVAEHLSGGKEGSRHKPMGFAVTRPAPRTW